MVGGSVTGGDTTISRGEATMTRMRTTKDNIAIKIKKMQDDDTRKVVEDKVETKEPEQPSEQSSGAIRKSSREREPTKRYEDYELYVTVVEEPHNPQKWIYKNFYLSQLSVLLLVPFYCYK